MDELQRISVDEFKKSKKLPVVIVLDNVRSMNNVGSIFRTADAFRVEHIYLCGITAQPPHKEIEKTALGATETVSWKYYKTTQEAMDDLKSKGYFVASIEQDKNSIMLNQFQKPNKPLALVF